MDSNAMPEDRDRHVVGQFFAKVKWPSLVAQLGDGKELARLVSPSSSSPLLTSVHNLLEAYMGAVIVEMERLGDHLLLRWLINEGGAIETLPNKGFKALQEESSEDKYIRLMAR
ncbi:hypothetical protein EV182_005808, partial [Spiromyces aspiralis]